MLNEHIYKQPLVVFLGAGASAPLGKMTTVQFLNWVRRRDEVDFNVLNKVIENIGPSKEVGMMPDIEAVLDCLEKFIEGRELYEKLSGFGLTSSDQYIKLRDQIEDLVVTHYSEIDANDAFNHYKPLLQECLAQVIPIFTTNYDLSVEKAFEGPQAQFKLIDGFHRRRRVTPKWSANAYHDYKPSKKGGDIILFKLHGSVDWVRTPSDDIQRVEAGKRDPGNLKTVIVYPTRIKREIHEEPFRTNYDYLLACLTHAKSCIVIGFSFRDQEIVEHFREAVGMNENLQVVVFDKNKAIEEHIIGKFKPNRGLITIEVGKETTEVSGETIEVGSKIPNQNILMATGVIDFQINKGLL